MLRQKIKQITQRNLVQIIWNKYMCMCKKMPKLLREINHVPSPVQFLCVWMPCKCDKAWGCHNRASHLFFILFSICAHKLVGTGVLGWLPGAMNLNNVNSMKYTNRIWEEKEEKKGRNHQYSHNIEPFKILELFLLMESLKATSGFWICRKSRRRRNRKLIEIPISVFPAMLLAKHL